MTARFYAFTLPLVSITPSVLLLASPFHHFASDSTADTKLLHRSASPIRNAALLYMSFPQRHFALHFPCARLFSFPQLSSTMPLRNIPSQRLNVSMLRFPLTTHDWSMPLQLNSEPCLNSAPVYFAISSQFISEASRSLLCHFVTAPLHCGLYYSTPIRCRTINAAALILSAITSFGFALTIPFLA